MTKIKEAIVWAILLILLILSPAACKADDYDISKENSVTEKYESGANNMSIINTWFANSFSKIQPDTKGNGNTEYKIYTAKNETESCQLILHSEHTISNLIIECKKSDNIDVEILRE
ncbi:MAG: hypothetical protein PHZ09_07935, partial [Eubacteriales bacterium]|nr:hypothetical protein [Eubacteriales bacterium]